MTSSGDAAEQVVRLSLEGFEVAVRLTGSAAKEVAILLASALKQEVTQSGMEQGEAIGKLALDCGFSDQSHFTNYFKSFIGITPKQYQSIFTQKRSELDE